MAAGISPTDILPGAIGGAAGFWLLFYAVRTALSSDRPLTRQLHDERARNRDLVKTVRELRDEAAEAESEASRYRNEKIGLEIQLRYAREDNTRLAEELRRSREGAP